MMPLIFATVIAMCGVFSTMVQLDAIIKPCAFCGN